MKKADKGREEITDTERKELELLADEPYRVFHSRLLPGTDWKRNIRR